MQFYWYKAKEFEVDQFRIVVEWTYEDCSIRDCFDETEEEFSDMFRRLDAGIDTHYMVRVRAMYDDVELGVACLGSCYARDCTPEQDIEEGIGGYLADLVDEAVDQARSEAVAMLQRLKKDFLKEVDNNIVLGYN